MELGDSLAVAIARTALAKAAVNESVYVSVDRFTLLCLIAERHAGWAIACPVCAIGVYSDNLLAHLGVNHGPDALARVLERDYARIDELEAGIRKHRDAMSLSNDDLGYRLGDARRELHALLTPKDT